jgi:hypothetical protein
MADAALVDVLTRTIREAQQTSGAGYYGHQQPRLEPTAWCALARPGEDTAPCTRALRTWQRRDGHVVDPSSPQANFAWDALALIAQLGPASGKDPALRALADAIVETKGIRLDDSSAIRQDQSIQAWPWIDGTFSWVEPTAWSLIAIKRTRSWSPNSTARIRDGERMLIDRVCHDGGWNYGNSNAFTQDLRPYVPTTALALLALADRPNEAAVQRSIAWLEANGATEASAMGLSLAAIALHVHGRASSRILNDLATQYSRTLFLGNTHLSAMALYALTISSHDAEALRVASSVGAHT